MKLYKIKKSDVSNEWRTPQDARRVFNRLDADFAQFNKNLRNLSALVPRVRTQNKRAREELAKKMIGMSDSILPMWDGIKKEVCNL